MLVAVALTVWTAALGGCSWSSPGASAVHAAGDGVLVFVAPGPSHGLGVDNTDLYAVGSGGGAARDLTRTAAAEQNAAWTPDGSRVVFTRQSTTGSANGHVTYHMGVFTMTLGGSAHLIRRCSALCDARDFTWSPNTQQIAFVSNVKSRLTGYAAEVMVMNADGSGALVVCGEARCGQGLEGPQWSPDGSRLVFSNQGVLGFLGIGILPSGIWAANENGSGVGKLTQPACRPGTPRLVGCFFDSAPDWSPDGSMITFSRLDQRVGGHTSTSQLEVMRPDGSGLHTIGACQGYRCNQVMAPVWSPGGSRIAFANGAYQDPSITLAAPSGDQSVTIRACAGSRCVTPTSLVWAPDGRSLAIVSSTSPSPAWVIGTDGRGMHMIAPNVSCCLAWLARGAVPVPPQLHLTDTASPSLSLGGTIAFASDASSPGNDSDQDIYRLDPQTAAVSRVTRGPRFNFEPAWAPDGRRIAFAGVRPNHNTNIFVVNGDGSDEHAITHLASGVTEPAWAPDGRTVAFVTDGGIDIANADGSSLHRLVTGSDRDPAWSPDGRLIAFTHDLSDGSEAIFTMHSDGSGLRRVTDLPGSQTLPAWAPNGQRIAFVWTTSAGSGLYLISPTGAELRRVTADPIRIGRPAWSPDGRYIAFSTGYTLYRSIIAVVAITTGHVTTLATIHGNASDVAWTPGP
jgi:Tol biopolymer transport system component